MTTQWSPEMNEKATSFGHSGQNAAELLATLHTGVCVGVAGMMRWDAVVLVSVHCSMLASCEVGMPRQEEEEGSIMGDGSLASDLFLPPSLSISHTHTHTYSHTCTHTHTP